MQTNVMASWVTLLMLTCATASAPNKAQSGQLVDSIGLLIEAQTMPSAGRVFSKRLTVVEVQPGDTLHAIARRHGVPREQLIRLNGLRDDRIAARRLLILSDL